MQELHNRFSIAQRWLKAVEWQDQFMLAQLLSADACLGFHNGQAAVHCLAKAQIVTALIAESKTWRKDSIHVESILINGQQVTISFDVLTVRGRQLDFEKRVAILVINGREIETLILRHERNCQVRKPKAAAPTLTAPSRGNAIYKTPTFPPASLN